MAEIEKLPLSSPDIKTGQIEKLKSLFPEAFTEGGKLDFDRLRASLGDAVDDGPERFGLSWPGKRDCFRLIQEPSTGTLLPSPEESLNWDTTQNLFLEADNLEALKLLQKSYYGKVKMIYIDPPYNTGKDFIYPDRYAENLRTYLAYTGQANDEGYRFTTNPDTDGRFHSRWLNMMYPRLFLAKNLLRDDGVIFVSIDDNEVINLRAMMNEVFGEENFVASFIWKRRQNVDSRSKNGASTDHEYLICYGKTPSGVLKGAEKDLTKYSNPDDDPKGDWMSADMTGLATKDQRPNLHYDLEDPSTKIVYPCPPTGWRYEKKRMSTLIENKEIIFPKTVEGRPRRKKFLKDLQSDFTGFSTVLNTVFNTQATRELRSLFDDKEYFDFPKPWELLALVFKTVVDEDDLILDFFSGSSTTAHAVLDLNKTDGGNRRFILVQLPEPVEENSEAAKAGYRSIADIGKERIRRVIARIEAEAKDLAQKISATLATLAALAEEEKTLRASLPPQLFSDAALPKELTKLIEKQQKAHEELEQAQEQLERIRQGDLGFRVFRLGESNFKTWDGDLEREDLTKQLELALDYIRPGSTEQAMLCELLLKSGFTLTTPVGRLTLAGKTVWSVDGGSMLVCLERPLTQEVTRAMAAMQPPRVVVLDEGFKDNDPLKTNAVQVMRSHGVEDFRTV
ncbi:MAG: site-specific DNA-methyltransferase [Saprospiraceae bacterium]|nr:MAG: site-specific DNA-methyltransferase [Saprospiraceae bacterium]